MSEAENRRKFRRMRRIATASLVLMGALLLLTRFGQTQLHLPWLGYVHAFAEAAVVGGLADWFAVTALFRHPLGIPIPHTAIIPHNQPSIARGIARFVEGNFLAPEILEDKIQSLDLIGRSERWLAEPENSRMVAERVTAFLPELVDGLDDDDVQDFLVLNLSAGLERADVATILGQLLELINGSDRENEIFNDLVSSMRGVLQENKPALRKALRKESPWLFRGIMENQIFDRIVAKIDRTFDEISADPNHPFRKRILAEIDHFAQRLQTDEELRKEIGEIKLELMQNPKVTGYVRNLWVELKTNISEDTQRENSKIREAIYGALHHFSNSLLKDRVVRLKINSYINDGIIRLLARNRQNIAELIENTINNWDKKTMVDKLEIQVGRDLQYIRINGTLVGGAVGLILHAIAQLF